MERNHRQPVLTFLAARDVLSLEWASLLLLVVPAIILLNTYYTPSPYCVPNILPLLAHSSFTKPYESGTVITHCLQMKKLGHPGG